MKSKRDNKIILDINKAQWARFYYRNQHGDTRDYIPHKDWMTINNTMFSKTELAGCHPMYPNELLIDRALRLSMLDIWTPECMFKVTANACVIYTGDKAVSMYDAWKAKIFGK